MSVTQKDLAERLGVSQMAVSFALNGKPGVNEETRARIVEAAEEAGYRPNAAARITKSGATRNVDLLMSLDGSASRIPHGFLEGVEGGLRRHGLHLTISRLSDDQFEEDAVLPRVAREVSADGLLINYTHNFPPRLVELFKRHRIPAVWVNAPREQRCVRPDDRLAGVLAAEHLLALGHRRAGLYFVGPAEHVSREEREAGFRETLAAAEAESEAVVGVGDPRPYRKGPDPAREAERLAVTMAWLRRPDRPAAVVGYSDTESCLLMLAAARLGLRVPEDLSVLAIADAVPEAVGVAMTTVAMPWEAVGREAVEMLAREIAAGRGAEPAPAMLVPPWLLPGVTTGPPRE